jgi:hypothetical protein
VGKSTLCKFLTGWNECKIGNGIKSCTANVKGYLGKKTFYYNGVTYKPYIIDIPGFQDTNTMEDDDLIDKI